MALMISLASSAVELIPSVSSLFLSSEATESVPQSELVKLIDFLANFLRSSAG